MTSSSDGKVGALHTDNEASAPIVKEPNSSVNQVRDSTEAVKNAIHDIQRSEVPGDVDPGPAADFLKTQNHFEKTKRLQQLEFNEASLPKGNSNDLHIAENTGSARRGKENANLNAQVNIHTSTTSNPTSQQIGSLRKGPHILRVANSHRVLRPWTRNYQTSVPTSHYLNNNFSEKASWLSRRVSLQTMAPNNPTDKDDGFKQGIYSVVNGRVFRRRFPIYAARIPSSYKSPIDRFLYGTKPFVLGLIREATAKKLQEAYEAAMRDSSLGLQNALYDYKPDTFHMYAKNEYFWRSPHENNLVDGFLIRNEGGGDRTANVTKQQPRRHSFTGSYEGASFAYKPLPGDGTLEAGKDKDRAPIGVTDGLGQRQRSISLQQAPLQEPAAAPMPALHSGKSASPVNTATSRNPLSLNDSTNSNESLSSAVDIPSSSRSENVKAQEFSQLKNRPNSVTLQDRPILQYALTDQFPQLVKTSSLEPEPMHSEGEFNVELLSLRKDTIDNQVGSETQPGGSPGNLASTKSVLSPTAPEFVYTGKFSSPLSPTAPEFKPSSFSSDWGSLPSTPQGSVAFSGQAHSQISSAPFDQFQGSYSYSNSDNEDVGPTAFFRNFLSERAPSAHHQQRPQLRLTTSLSEHPESSGSFGPGERRNIGYNDKGRQGAGRPTELSEALLPHRPARKRLSVTAADIPTMDHDPPIRRQPATPDMLKPGVVVLIRSTRNKANLPKKGYEPSWDGKVMENINEFLANVGEHPAIVLCKMREGEYLTMMCTSNDNNDVVLKHNSKDIRAMYIPIDEAYHPELYPSVKTNHGAWHRETYASIRNVHVIPIKHLSPLTRASGIRTLVQASFVQLCEMWLEWCNRDQKMFYYDLRRFVLDSKCQSDVGELKLAFLRVEARISFFNIAQRQMQLCKEIRILYERRPYWHMPPSHIRSLAAVCWYAEELKRRTIYPYRYHGPFTLRDKQLVLNFIPDVKHRELADDEEEQFQQAKHIKGGYGDNKYKHLQFNYFNTFDRELALAQTNKDNKRLQSLLKALISSTTEVKRRAEAAANLSALIWKVGEREGFDNTIPDLPTAEFFAGAIETTHPMVDNMSDILGMFPLLSCRYPMNGMHTPPSSTAVSTPVLPEGNTAPNMFVAPATAQASIVGRPSNVNEQIDIAAIVADIEAKIKLAKN